MYRTTWSFVLEAKPHGRSINWFGWDAPHGTAYLPLMGAATEPAPDSYHTREGHISKFSTKCAWWAFNIVNQYQDLKYNIINPHVLKNSHRIETEAVEAVASWNEEADKLDGDEAAKLKLLTERSNAFAEKQVGEYWDFAFSLFAKFGRYVITYNESAVGGETLMRYPLWWLQSPEVGFTSWQPQGPFHGVLLDATTPIDTLASSTQNQGNVLGWCLMVAFSSTVAAVVAHHVGLQSGKRSTEPNMNYYIVSA